MKFFVRACKQEKMKYVCLRDKNCSITKESRVQCQFCRYQKCLQLKMFCPASGSMKKEDKNVSDIPCRVCGAPSSGFHFGALTCEGCKGFFRRMAKERESNKYHCSKGGFCEINSLTRNICKACRYKKCLEANMSIEASRIGRQPNAIKHAISLELQNRSDPGERQGYDIMNTSDQDTDILMEIKQEPFSNENSVDCTEYEDNIMKDDNTSDKSTEENLNDKEKLISENFGNIQSMDMFFEGKSLTDDTKDGTESSSGIDDSWMEIISKMEKASKELIPICKQEQKSYDEKNFQNVEICWNLMMKEFDHNALCIIRFAKKVLGFKTLTMDDQVKLIQSSIYPIVVLNFSKYFDHTTKNFKYFNFGMQEMEAIFQLFPMLKILASHFRHAGEMAHNLELDELEYCFLSTLLLYNGEKSLDLFGLTLCFLCI
ncbi:hypothetical protein KUTeg_013964 [Tegillarca granosa]|uniref:Nuclear receptor domain-containing protein n=1 Tax=Tegillarca granosa TaxID=220873 RepID=A0ABQ9F0D8_TEGGR|nr:hypothetical protein KUTeg_013964 [Tegillarca granosa]